jgi:hypothetical protein
VGSRAVLAWLAVFAPLAGCGFLLGGTDESTSPTTVDDAAVVDAADDASGAPTDGAPDAGDADAMSDARDVAPAPLRVFVTSGLNKYSGDVLTFGDDSCQNVADANGLGRSFIAWLPKGGVPAATRLVGDGPWVLLDGTEVAKDKNGLLSGTLEHAIDMDETTTSYPSGSLVPVWTGTKADGTLAQDCGDWSGTSPGMSGLAKEKDGTWTESETKDCSLAYRIYCFEHR